MIYVAPLKIIDCVWTGLGLGINSKRNKYSEIWATQIYLGDTISDCCHQFECIFHPGKDPSLSIGVQRTLSQFNSKRVRRNGISGTLEPFYDLLKTISTGGVSYLFFFFYSPSGVFETHEWHVVHGLAIMDNGFLWHVPRTKRRCFYLLPNNCCWWWSLATISTLWWPAND